MACVEAPSSHLLLPHPLLRIKVPRAAWDAESQNLSSLQTVATSGSSSPTNLHCPQPFARIKIPERVPSMACVAAPSSHLLLPHPRLRIKIPAKRPSVDEDADGQRFNPIQKEKLVTNVSSPASIDFDRPKTFIKIKIASKTPRVEQVSEALQTVTTDVSSPQSGHLHCLDKPPKRIKIKIASKSPKVEEVSDAQRSTPLQTVAINVSSPAELPAAKPSSQPERLLNNWGRQKEPLQESASAAQQENLGKKRATCSATDVRLPSQRILQAKDKATHPVKLSGFSVSLSREEIKADLLKMGLEPSRRPKKRPRAVQKQMDDLFPGLRLSGITADSYKVKEPKKKALK